MPTRRPATGIKKKENNPTEPILAVQPMKATPNYGTAERRTRRRTLKGEDQLLPLEMP